MITSSENLSSIRQETYSKIETPVLKVQIRSPTENDEKTNFNGTFRQPPSAEHINKNLNVYHLQRC